MKAAVCYEYNKPLVIEDLKIDPPKTGEVRVRIGATAICHSDVHARQGAWWEPLPVVLGHETAGWVEEVGQGVTRVKPGDAVTVSIIKSCRKCYNCLSGHPYICSTFTDLDNTARLHNQKGQDIRQGTRVAGFAEYSIADETQCTVIPSDVPLDSMSLLACGFITGFFGVVNQENMKPLSSAAVIGCGGVGLSAIQGAVIRGAYPVIAVDVIDEKLEIARKFGATHTINSRKVDPIKAAADLTDGRGPDWAFMTVGSAKALLQALQMCNQRGHAVAIGTPDKSEILSFSPLELAFFKEKTLSGVFMGLTNPAIQVPQVVELYKAGRIKLDEMITHRFPLEKINEAMEEVEKGEVIRNVIVFPKK
jgi:S-(hydroxymethyl)glutathione dehydrogenase / alcohol dehydrogenase